MADHIEEFKALERLREAVNEAWKAGASEGMIKSVVHDQLFGIEHLGKGDVDVMKAREGQIADELRRKAEMYK